MTSEKQKVLIDADFFRHTTDYEIGTGLFKEIMEEFNYEPIMIKYVADIELRNNIHLETLRKTGYVKIFDERQVLINEDESYRDFFINAYYKLNQLEFPNGENIQTYGYDRQYQDENLGEIRSLYFAHLNGLKFLLSDDGGAKHIAEFYFNSGKHKVSVKTLYNLLIENIENNGRIIWKDIKVTVSKVYKLDTKKRNLLCELYKHV